MTRYLKPTPTRGSAPSHSPPDVIFAPGRKLARALGWFSIGLGLAELAAPRAVERLTGVHSRRWLKASGLREILCGVGILSGTRPAGWLWGRVAGDGLDLATLTKAMAERNGTPRRRKIAAAASVLGVTALDVVCGTQLSVAAKMAG